MVYYPGSGLMSGLRELLKTGQFSDFIIKCGAREFKVHKMLLCSQSAYFRAAMGGDFKEAHTNMITLTEPENIVEGLIQYFYQCTWDESVRGDTPKALFCVQIYQVADKYDVPHLRTLATNRFKISCETTLLNVPAFVEAIYAIDECCNPEDRTLWDIVMPILKSNMVPLLEHEEFRAMIKDKDELNFELLRLLASDKKEEADGGRKSGGEKLPPTQNFSAISLRPR
ncbi:hypothetical protein PRZ48_006050 [Zasmidium cellare]|uniref:BTB domain-containing protein n=1 Tax=Zasmidium cellare TaxID=395010 RepID=A0ABR0ELZ1_ZASCE|nr:hypothetical protein PRZ48_006050 [Zasmidium cellare]